MRQRRRDGPRGPTGSRPGRGRPPIDPVRPTPEPAALAIAAAPAPWYAAGLRFGCTGCGLCCRREGYVWLGPRDVARLAEHLGLSVPDFLTRYTREVAVEGQDEPGISLARAPGGCIFLDEDRNACRVHPARPTQCRAFPFWPANLDSAEAWRREVVALCGERAVAQGHVYTAEEIRDISAPLSTGGAVAPAGRREPGTGEH